jgi:hypothetical protein
MKGVRLETEIYSVQRRPIHSLVPAQQGAVDGHEERDG